MRVDRRLLGWGTFLVIAGAIPLAVRASVISADALAGWPSLWPLLLIGAGLSLVLRRTPIHLLGGSVSVLTAGVMLGGALASGFHDFPAFGACGNTGAGAGFASRSGTLSGVADVQVEFDCGHLRIDTADGNGWLFGGSGPAGQEPEVSADAGRVRITPARDTFTFNEPASTWDVTVPRAPNVGLSVTLNAGEGDIDLGQAVVEGLSVTLNAGSLNADLSRASSVTDVSATINAGSAALRLPSNAGGASVTLNAGSAKVCVPAGSAVRVSWSGTLASNNFDSLGLIRQGDNHWITAGLTSPAIDLNISANAGSFTLVLGGSCHA